MKVKIALIVTLVTSCLVYSGCYMIKKHPLLRETWRQFPLASSAQREAGSFGGEGMQMVQAIAYAKSNPQTVYLVSDTSQVWKSTDGGNFWEMKHKGFLSNGGIAISVDPVNENIIYVAGSYGEANKKRYSKADGIYRSTDGGENWFLVKPTPFFKGKEGEHFVFDYDSTDNKRTRIVYAGTHEDGLLISTDGGDTWNQIGFIGERIKDMEIDPVDSSIIYLLTVKGLFKILIRGNIIFHITQLSTNIQGNFSTFALNPDDPLIMYLAMGKDGVYKALDGGKTFFKLSGVPAGLNCTQIAVSPANPDYVYVSVHEWNGLNPIWSHDAGKSWQLPQTIDKFNDSLTKGRYFSAPISPHPYDEKLALTSASGADRILKTYDAGISWFYSGNGYTGGRRSKGTTSLAFYPDSKKMIFFLIDFGPAVTTDGGNTFQLLNVPRVYGKRTTPVGAVSPVFDNGVIITAIGGWWRQKIAVSRDGGSNWTIIPGTDDNYRFIAFHPQSNNIIYAQRFMSRDSGLTWEPLSHKIYAMYRGNGDTVYSLSEVNEKKSIIIRSDDKGASWKTPYSYLDIKADSVNEIAVDPSNKNRVYVASESGLYLFDEEQNTWVHIGEETGMMKDRFGGMSVKCIAVDPVNPNVVYAGRWAAGKGHANGIFRSVDYGRTWTNITFELGPEFTVWSISVSPYDGMVFIGSSHGTWTMPPQYGFN
jgi:photosystem II stability/assembly factor-like uncharacterized protein